MKKWGLLFDMIALMFLVPFLMVTVGIWLPSIISSETVPLWAIVVVVFNLVGITIAISAISFTRISKILANKNKKGRKK